jgi:type IV pilus assembly protein PilQ
MGVQAMQPRITVNYDSASMLDVLAGFSEFAGVSIVPNGGAADVAVRGIDIRDQPWDIALSAILSAQGLGWNTTDSGIIIVDKLENLRARDTLLSETRVMRINYASADSVAATLAQLATPQRGQVVAYAGTNSVIVTDAPSVVARMDSIVRALDKRTPQVAIEARIVFVDRSDVFELGIVYDLKERDGGFVEQGINDVIAVPDPNEPPQLVDTDGDGIPDQAFFKRTNETLVNIGGDALATLANANDRVVSPALQILTAVAFGEFSLFTFIEALEAHQLSDVQAVPSIRVVDNHHARIHVGEKTPIRVLEAGAQTEQARVNVQFEETGIILDVTPHITNNNQILMDLSAERSALDVGPSDVGFIFKKQLGETRLLLSDGETAVIGGLTLSEVERSVSGIPGLMNIPLLGYLFRTTKEQESKTDLIILVTPHIVWPEDMQPPGR